MFSSTSSALPSEASIADAHAHQGLLDEPVVSPSLPAQCALSLPNVCLERLPFNWSYGPSCVKLFPQQQQYINTQ